MSKSKVNLEDENVILLKNAGKDRDEVAGKITQLLKAFEDKYGEQTIADTIRLYRNQELYISGITYPPTFSITGVQIVVILPIKI